MSPASWPPSSRAPRAGEVYNLGGGKANSTSILEAFKLAESFTGKAQVHTYVEQNRIGDHICYYSDLRKMRKHYPVGHHAVAARDRAPDRGGLAAPTAGLTYPSRSLSVSRSVDA
jgi:hypothetical protein